MSVAIHTKYRRTAASSCIKAYTKGMDDKVWSRLPYPHELPNDQKHPAAAKALAEKMGWNGLWVVGENADGSICAVMVNAAIEPDHAFGREGADWFFVKGKE